MKTAKKSDGARNSLACAITFAVVYTLNALIISPIGIMLAADVVYADSVLPTLLAYIAEFTEICAISVCYAVMITRLYASQKSGILFAIFISATAYKYIANTAVSWILSGSIPSMWAWDVVNVVYFTVLELLQLTVVFLLARSIIGKYTDKRLLAQRVFEKTGESLPQSSPYPFERVYDKGNCLLRSAFICATVTFIAKLFGNVVSDVWAILTFGFPTEWQTWMYMLFSYASKALFGVIVYFTVYMTLQSFLKKSNV